MFKRILRKLGVPPATAEQIDGIVVKAAKKKAGKLAKKVTRKKPD